jgi:hypothetical protein
MTIRRWTLILALPLATFAGGWLAGQSQAQPAPAPLVYELRTYTTLDGKLPALHKRFRDHTLKLFAKHGMKNVIYLTPIGEDNKLVYLLGHESKEAAEHSFAAFRADPEWIKVRDESEKDGKIVAKVDSVFFVPTDYSPIK